MLASRIYWGVTLGAVGLAALPATAAPVHARQSAARRNPSDSFLPVAATSVSGVVRQIQSDPAVRRRYARYFHIPESRVADYLRQNLVASRLPSAGRYTMYLVRTNGLIYPVMTTVPQGAPVFALQTRPPVLLSAGEGNPIKQFKTPVEVVYVQAPPRHAPEVKVAPSVETQILVPVKPQETIVPTIVITPIYRPASPLSPAEQAPQEESGAGSTEKTASKP